MGKFEDAERVYVLPEKAEGVVKFFMEAAGMYFIRFDDDNNVHKALFNWYAEKDLQKLERAPGA